MTARIIPVTTTDFVRMRILFLLLPMIRLATYKNVMDKNIFNHSKIPSARFIAFIKERADTNK